MKTHSDFPPEADTRDKKIILIAQHAQTGLSQLFSAAWNDKDQAFLTQADQTFRFVAMLVERLRVQAAQKEPTQ